MAFFLIPGVINALLSYLHKKKGEEFIPFGITGSRDPYDQLALHFEEHVDMKKIIGDVERELTG